MNALSWKNAMAVLLGGAALATIVRVLDSSFVGRFAGVLAAGALVAVALAVRREQQWAWGAAFLLGLCWFWAAIALRVQDVLSVGEGLLWLAWSAIVIVASVRGRND